MDTMVRYINVTTYLSHGDAADRTEMPSVANPNPDRARRGAAVEKPEPVIEELLPIRAAAAPTTAALAPGPSQVAPIAPPPRSQRMHLA